VRAILDTQALLWFINGDSRMPKRARAFMANEDNELLLSMVSAWEIIIKAGTGRLEITRPPAAYLLHCMSVLSLVPLAISFEHIFAIANLPRPHSDPFDRLLIAQATAEGLPIVTGDSAFSGYGIDLIW
jgi:PIN domain nuclease of toxin-antitoxin system